MPLKLWLIFFGLIALSSCGVREIAEISAPVPNAKIEPIYFATQRQPDETANLFGKRRPRKMNYGIVDVSIPPNHQLGKIEWARGAANPDRHFAAVRLEPFSGVDTFRRAVTQAPSAPYNVTNLYVHGFNTTTHQATFRLAQMKHDFNDPSPAVLFAWPSAASARAYVYDRDSVLFARDDLVDLIRDLTTGTDRGIALTGHSMGAQLVMEALRQIAISGDRKTLSKVAGVILVSPDIDPDVFRRQAEAIGKLPEEFYIFVAKQDRALRLSSILTGQNRIGVIQSTRDVAGLDVTVVDFSQFKDGKNLNHQVGLTSPTAIQVLSGLLERNPSLQSGITEFLTLTPN